MLQEFVDNLLAVTKESVKTFTYESLNNIARLINGVSALLLALLPWKSNILEGASGWELRPSFRGPRLPRWMENGASSFNEFIHELSFDSSDAETSSEYSNYGEEEHGDAAPHSPLSTSSRISRTGSFSRYDRRLVRLVRYVVSWMLWPITLLLWLPLVFFQMFRPRQARSGVSNVSANGRKTVLVKEHVVVQRATDRRRGVFEDLQLATEMFIESVFEAVQKAAHFILSPTEAGNKVYSWLYPQNGNGNDDDDDDDGEGSGSDDNDIPVPTATIGSADPVPTRRPVAFPHYLNTDSRTCEDVINELGYPYEAIKVVTSDGYILLLERLPRRDSQKVVLLQHGILDSSMGWVSNGVVGSPAFAAYDQGYDVYLGNLRGLVSREHVDKNLSSRMYWRYSINEHGTRDMPAIIEKIHEIKSSELSKTSPIRPREDDDDVPPEQPYKLSAICHSLGGAVMLMYVVTQKLSNSPHHLSRLIMLSPAGFHEDLPLVFTIVEKFVVLLGPILAPLFPGLYIPTRFFRMLLNKLARDFHNYPGLGGLVQTLMGYAVGGDSSNWLGAIGLPHYNMYDMPGVSFHVALHLAQIKRSKKFRMYDYGSASANMEAYGSPEPLDIGANYNVMDVPVDLVAGRRDRIVPPSMVRKHYRIMKRAGVEVSYNEFEYAHLDFTFSHREELLAYVMSRLMVEKGNGVRGTSVRVRKVKRRSEIVEAEGETETLTAM